MGGASIDRCLVIVLDSVGAGAAPDAADYGDTGASTLGNMSRAVGGMDLPTLGRLGLGNITEIAGVPPNPAAYGAYGRMREASAGKDTETGHWEMMGLKISVPFATFPDGFPPEIVDPFVERIGRGILGNRAESGTEILDELGVEHMSTGKPIVYTSADSVFQIAAHEEIVPLDELYDWCRAARRILDPYMVGRVIARPFLGTGPGRFNRTYNRKDFGLKPPGRLALNSIADAGFPVVGIGKIRDIYSGEGVTESIHTEGNADGMRKTLTAFTGMDRGVVMTNLVDFDSSFGHRRDPVGYYGALREFDRWCGDELLEELRPGGDLVLVTADHGNDPTFRGTDHTREFVPLLAFGPTTAAGVDLGTRETFSDLGATLIQAMGAEPVERGTGFLDDIT